MWLFMRCDLWLQLKEMFRNRFQKPCALFNSFCQEKKARFWARAEATLFLCK